MMNKLPPTRHCDECKLADISNPRLRCTIGHKPRFYMPVGEYPWFENDYGWKRKCSDYIKGEPSGVPKKREIEL